MKKTEAKKRMKNKKNNYKYNICDPRNSSIKIWGDFVVEHSEKIARMFNISEKIISLTIIAIGTSLPELVTSVTAAIKTQFRYSYRKYHRI